MPNVRIVSKELLFSLANSLETMNVYRQIKYTKILKNRWKLMCAGCYCLFISVLFVEI